MLLGLESQRLATAQIPESAGESVGTSAGKKGTAGGVLGAVLGGGRFLWKSREIGTG